MKVFQSQVNFIKIDKALIKKKKKSGNLWKNCIIFIQIYKKKSWITKNHHLKSLKKYSKVAIKYIPLMIL